MIDPTTVSMIRDIVAIFGVIAGFTYYVITVRNQKRARQAQLLIQLYNRMQDRDLMKAWNELMTREWDSIEDYNKKYLGREELCNFVICMNWFESFGSLLKKGFLDADLVYEVIPTNATTFWEKYKPVVMWVRETGNYPHMFRPIEYLSDEMKKIASARGEANIDFDVVYNTEYTLNKVQETT